MPDPKRPSLLRQTAEFLWINKKWWMIPMALVLAALAGLIYLGGTSAAPFIYTLF